MSMESLGGSLVAGRPVVVRSGNDTHVFAIDGTGVMNRWSSFGAAWSGPHPLPGAILPASFPCGVALADGSVQVFAIGGAMQLMRWRASDGWAQAAPQFIPANGNGLAAVATPDGRIHVFANAGGQLGILQYSFAADATALPPGTSLPGSSQLGASVLAAVSAGGKIDVFAVGSSQSGVGEGTPLHWHFAAGTWSKRFLPGPLLRNVGGNGFAAIALAPDKVELFAIGVDGRLTNWSLDKQSTSVPPPALAASSCAANRLPAGSWPLLPDGVPAVVMTAAGDLEVFAIGPANFPNGGPLVHWRSDIGVWHAPVAHDASLANGGIGATAGAVFAFQAGITDNSLQLWPAGIGGISSTPWANWADNRRTPAPKGHCYPTCLEELVAIAKTATQKGHHVRAVGSSWSFSDVAVTDGYVVETNRLVQFLDNVVPRALRSAIVSAMPDGGTIAPSKLIHVEAGIEVDELMKALDVRMQAPFTMGGSSGQTLAGVISTSVHGGDWRLPPLPDAVRAIHLVGPDGRQHWIEPDAGRITEHTELAKVLGPDVEIHYDDDWFDSVLVSVGSLGIIYSVVLEVTDQYHLEEKCQELSWTGSSGLRSMLVDGSLFTRGRHLDGSGQLTLPPRGVQVAIDTTMPGNEPRCFLTTRVAQTPQQAVSLGSPLGADNPMGEVTAVFCECDMIGAIFGFGMTVVGPPLVGTMLAVLSTMVATVPVLVPVLAEPTLAATMLTALAVGATATTVVAAAPAVLVAALKAGPPGTVGDFIAAVLTAYPALTPELVKVLTGQVLKPGRAVVNPDGTPGVVPSRRTIAHNIMGPKDRGECLARGLCREIAFDTTDLTYLDFLDAAFALLDAQAKGTTGNILAGWFSLRFVGRSRAALSPQRSAMTCMVEFAGIRGLACTKVLLDQLEALARAYKGIQHWGMFEDLRSSDVDAAYPRLDTWLRVRQELTKGGTVHTFDNEFTDRCGLTAVPNPPRVQIFPGTACSLGSVALHQQKSASLRFRNEGGRTLRVEGFDATGDFDLQRNLLLEAVTPTARNGYEIEVKVTYAAEIPGPHNGTLTIKTNAREPANGNITIPITAQVEHFAVMVLEPARGASLELGSIEVGRTATASITVRNDSTMDAVLDSFSFSSPAAATQIAVETGPIGKGKTRTYSVAYTPDASGPLTSDLTLVFTDGGATPRHSQAARVQVSGVGLGARAELTPAAVDFGDILVGRESPAVAVVVRNVGSEVLTITSWSNSNHFRVLGALPSSIAPGQSEQVSVVFRPGSPGRLAGDLSCSSNSIPAPPPVPLGGVGIMHSLLLAKPDALTFDEVPAGSRGRDLRVVLQNAGSLPIQIGAVAIVGTHGSEFRIVGPTAAGSLLPPLEGSHELMIAFSPSSSGGKEASVEIVHDGASSPLRISLGGRASASRGLVPDAVYLDFGRAPVGVATGERKLTLHNGTRNHASVARVTIGGPGAADFTIASDECSGSVLSPGTGCVVVLRAKPGAAGPREASLEVGADLPVAAIALRSEGVAVAATWTWIGTSIDFGQTNVGVQSERHNVDLHNAGAGPITVSQIELTGDFTFKNLAPTAMTIAANQDMSFAMWFIPTAAGPCQGWLRVHSDAPDSPHSLELVGLASAPAPVRPIHGPFTPRQPIP
jgi:FAD binding domain/Abnormal spindle-like microcephaly-assoc'd, ASPM-SPD-2-Hydin